VFYFPFTSGKLHLCTTIINLRGDKGENVKQKCVVEIENGIEPFRSIELIEIVVKKMGGIEPLKMCVL
jgi:hypothetical protein